LAACGSAAAPRGRDAGTRGPQAAAPQAPGAGLVTYPTTGREASAVPDYAPSVRDVWAPKFPRADLVDVAAGQFTPLPPWRGEEGPRFRIVISPGAMAVETRDLARAERTAERQQAARESEVEMIAAYIAEHGHPPEDPAPAREITEWSRKSRARMFRAFCELDYGPLLEREGIPAMVTLTYPADWLAVAPDGKAVKAHFKAFRKRWERTWGQQLLALWKLEFQARGAPHLHLFTVVPDGRTADGQHFREWLSAAWASVVGHPDPEEYRKHLLAGTGVDYAAGLRSSDPRRIAVYFSKHASFSAKEYQNVVPAEWREPGKGPGRFWGYWGLEKCTRAVEVAPDAAVRAARVMRRWAHAQGVTREVRVRRTRGGAVQAGEPVIGLAGAQLVEAHTSRRRKVRRRVQRMYRGHGWISLNDGPAFAAGVARYLSSG
jgi:hypothetical protein